MILDDTCVMLYMKTFSNIRRLFFVRLVIEDVCVNTHRVVSGKKKYCKLLLSGVSFYLPSF